MKLTLHFKNLLLTACLSLIGILMFAQPTFINEVRIPPLIKPNANGFIDLDVVQTFHKFNPGDASDTLLNGNATQPDGIASWAYNETNSQEMTILGPTLLWPIGSNIDILVTNRLDQLTTVHWHGAQIPAIWDGGPHQPINASGGLWNPIFTNIDPVSSLWYHPHIHNNTFPQVQLGLSGMIISEDLNDPIRATLPHTYGVDDLPIIFGDQKLTYDSMSNKMTIDTVKGKRPLNIVNGVTNPYLEVPPHMLRLRLLNGSTRKAMMIGVSQSYQNPDPTAFDDFYHIATDGGYLLEPTVRKNLLFGPGAREEIVLDLSGYQPYDVVYIRNLNDMMPGYLVGSPHPSPSFPGGGGGGGGDATQGESLLQLRIVADSNFPSTYTPIDNIPAFMTEWPVDLQTTDDVDRVRQKNLMYDPTTKFTIDNETYSMTHINDTICVGAKEIWEIHNQTPIAHPFHIHKIEFRVLEIDSMGTMIDPASRGFNGLKDDVLILPNWKLKFMAKFDDFPNEIVFNKSYMYHCHILTHEDVEGGGMMHQFVVTDNPLCEPLAVDDIFEDDEITLFPNPALEELYLGGSYSKESRIEILDIRGGLMKSQKLPAFDESVAIGINGLTSGMYIVTWHTDEGVLSRKLMIY